MYLGYYGWLIDGNKANDYNSQDLCLPLRLLLPEDISTDCINDWKKNKEWTRYVSKTYCCIGFHRDGVYAVR